MVDEELGSVVEFVATVELAENERPTPDETLDRIDDTLTFYSAGLGEYLTVKAEPVVDVPMPSVDPDTERFIAQINEALADLSAGWLPHLSEAARRAIEAFQWLEQLDEWLDAELRRVDAKRSRLRRMHHLYRLRRRGRW